MGKGIVDAVDKFTLRTEAISVVISVAGLSIIGPRKHRKNNAKDVALAMMGAFGKQM